MATCLVLKKVKFDDPMENFAIYGSAGFLSTLSSSFFLPYEGILWSGTQSGSILGVQLLGWVAISVWTAVICWVYFFSLKRCRVLRVRKAEEILGLDCID